MALTLSSSSSSTMEPFRKNRWVMQFTSIPVLSTQTGYEGALAFVAHTATRPTLTFNEVEYQRLNERFYMAGKPTWNAISMSFFDFIKQTETGGSPSASQILWDWANAVYNPITGAMGFKREYTTSGTLAMLDPAGGVSQVWNLFYCWPQEVNWGDLTADDDTLSEVSLNIRYDYAVKASEA
jgi:hypothetical protein